MKKIQWMDRDRFVARITRGVLWWRRVAEISYDAEGHRWIFASSRRPCPKDLVKWVDGKRDAAEERERQRELRAAKFRETLGDEAEWQRPVRLPRAEVRS